MLARITSCALAALALIGSTHAGSGWSNTFPPGNGLNGTVRALLAFDDGSGPALFVGGDFTAAGGIAANHIAKWDGDHWSALGAGVDGPVHALVVFDDGMGPALHVGGDFIHAGSGVANRLARWDGSTWFHLGSWTDQVVLALAVSNDALYAGGPAGVARWTGTSWTSQASLPVGFSLEALHTFDDGAGEKLYAGGFSLPPFALGAYRLVGSSWTAVGNLYPGTSTFTSYDRGDGLALYAGGEFNSGGVARWTGAAWDHFGSVDAPFTLAVHDDGNGADLYAGGGNLSPMLQGVATWDGTDWIPLDGGVTGGFVFALASFDDGSGPALYAAGSFNSADGQRAERIARWCCAIPFSVAFCPGSESACPCDGGNAGAGCQTATGTGGVTLSVLSQATQPNGAILVGQGYPSMGAPTAIVIRSPELDSASPVVFGDGLRCVGTSGLVRLAPTVAVGGTSTHVFGHSAAAGPGVFYYQLWFRDTPSTYCDPSTAFNLSSGRTLAW